MKSKEYAHMRPGEPIIGRVVNCVKLNVRVAPEEGAEVLGTIPVDSEVLIDENESTDAFYNVCVASGLEGFCMRQFIAV